MRLEIRRDVGHEAEEGHAVDEHEGIEEARAAVRQHAPIALERFGEAEPLGRPAALPEAEDRPERRRRGERRSQPEHAAPADPGGKQAGDRGAGELAEDHRRQEAADRNLAACHRDLVADHAERGRDHAAGRHAGEDPQPEQQLDRRRCRAERHRDCERAEADREDALLAERIGDGPEDRLDEGVGQRESGREQRDGVGIAPEIARDHADERLDRAPGGGRGKAAHRQDEDHAPNGAIEGGRRNRL